MAIVHCVKATRAPPRGTVLAGSRRSGEAVLTKSRLLFRGVNLVALIFTAAIPTTSVAAGEAPEVLLERYKCSICHADQEPKAGPAYVDIAAKYRGNPKAVSTVAAVVRKGAHGGGPWHMPPHPEVSEADATKIAQYILSQGSQKGGKKE